MGEEILIVQGRVWAPTVQVALEKIFEKHPGAEVSIWIVQKRHDTYWWEFTARLKEELCENS